MTHLRDIPSGTYMPKCDRTSQSLSAFRVLYVHAVHSVAHCPSFALYCLHTIYPLLYTVHSLGSHFQWMEYWSLNSLSSKRPEQFYIPSQTIILRVHTVCAANMVKRASYEPHTVQYESCRPLPINALIISLLEERAAGQKGRNIYTQ